MAGWETNATLGYETELVDLLRLLFDVISLLQIPQPKVFQRTSFISITSVVDS